MIIQVIILVFIVFVLGRTVGKFRHGDITIRELFLWVIFWLVVALATLMPHQTDVVAQFLGVERGADLLVYLSIIVLFFAVFKIIVKMEKTDKDITKLVRKVALGDNGQSDNQDS